uniref:Chitinase-3-like protein 1 n=1 Tax=Chrysemys picta bellii TaxID=8478 RepID=A0A8C3P8U4_CHRPI
EPRSILWATTSRTIATNSAYKLVCYFTNWAQDRTGEGHFVPDYIDPHLCTHLIYAFTNTAATLKLFLLRNPSLKTLLSIDGGKTGSDSFSTMVSSPANHWTFIRSVIEFLKMNKFDGFNLYWIYPEGKNKGYFTSLIQEMAKAFQEKAQKTGKQKLILSATVGAVRELVDASYEIDKISEAVDFLNLLTFDFHRSWQKVTGHVSPFLQGKEDSKSSSYYNVDYAVRYWRSKGAPAEKLIMGIPTYGWSFTLSSSRTGIGAPISGLGSPGPFTQEAGLLAYYEICTFTPGATTEQIVEQEVPYSYKGNQWVEYDDKQSITTKVSVFKEERGKVCSSYGCDPSSPVPLST